jgi:hypothetical protein
MLHVLDDINVGYRGEQEVAVARRRFILGREEDTREEWCCDFGMAAA